ncbi:hypothetical protein AB6H17_16750 [Proteus vulgaris]|uniref:hypothetical protein n=1 Tax=Proteus vulgaris TaxID=585 RepID=UPI0034DD5F99
MLFKVSSNKASSITTITRYSNTIGVSCSRFGVAFVPNSAEFICDKQKVTLLPLSGLYTQWEIGIIWNNNIKNKERDLLINIVSEEIDIT